MIFHPRQGSRARCATIDLRFPILNTRTNPVDYDTMWLSGPDVSSTGKTWSTCPHFRAYINKNIIATPLDRAPYNLRIHNLRIHNYKQFFTIDVKILVATRGGTNRFRIDLKMIYNTVNRMCHTFVNSRIKVLSIVLFHTFVNSRVKSLNLIFHTLLQEMCFF